MRTADICPTCATYFNAACVIYDGLYLTNLGVAPLTALDVVLGKINTAIVPLSGHGAPSSIPVYIGQEYIDVDVPAIYIGLSISSPDWGVLGIIATTTTTTTTFP
jgi:hypothetical protein